MVKLLLVLVFVVNALVAMDRLPAKEQYEIWKSIPVLIEQRQFDQAEKQINILRNLTHRMVPQDRLDDLERLLKEEKSRLETSMKEAALGKRLPVPEGEEPRFLDLQEEEAIVQTTFEELLQEASEEKPFVLAEVFTQSPESPRQYIHYFDASSIEQWQKDVLGNVLNPLNRLPINKIYYYQITSPEGELTFDRVVDIPLLTEPVAPAVQPQPVVLQHQDQIRLQELFNTLPGQPSIVDRYGRGDKRLNLSNLNLSQLSQEDLNSFFTRLIEIVPDLETLDLSRNQLTVLPESLGNLGNLRKLNVSHNRLAVLPESLGNLGNLRELKVFRNRLRDLPESLSNLNNLKVFDASNNQLEYLSESLGNLNNLEVFRISNNRLEDLPEFFDRLGSLILISIENNPWQQVSLVNDLSARLRARGVTIFRMR